MVGVPIAIANITIGIVAHGKGVLAIELRGNRPEALVFEQIGVEGRIGTHLRDPMALAAVKGMVRIGQIESLFKFLADCSHLIGGKKLAQNDETEGLEV